MKSVCVHYGCGLCAPQGWYNFDISPTLRLQRLPLIGWAFRTKAFPAFPPNVEYGDIIRGLPFKPGECRAIYCSHVLEHLALEDFRTAIANTYNLLELGGVFRFVLPDLEQLVQEYCNSPSANAALLFMRNSGLGAERRSRRLQAVIRKWLGNSSHLWMWDFKAISAELEQAKFREIRRAYFGDSQDLRFQEVENAERWRNSLGVECIR
jgi:hypothetical protein